MICEEQTWVAGVDGCTSGWVVVLWERTTGARVARIVPHISALLSLPEAPRVIAVDVPIGLEASSRPGGRTCEALARAILGARAASVFSAPTRGALEAFRAGADYRGVCERNRGEKPDGRGISRQTFAILPKIDEVDRVLTPDLQGRVVEVHPELCFAEANGRPMQHSKKTSAGRVERATLLARLGFPSSRELLGTARLTGAKVDDVLDACIACWTAGRVAEGAAIVLPSTPPLDPRGLRMELWR